MEALHVEQMIGGRIQRNKFSIFPLELPFYLQRVTDMFTDKLGHVSLFPHIFIFFAQGANSLVFAYFDCISLTIAPP